jgi:hypothetical protein
VRSKQIIVSPIQNVTWGVRRGWRTGPGGCTVPPAPPACTQRGRGIGRVGRGGVCGRAGRRDWVGAPSLLRPRLAHRGAGRVGRGGARKLGGGGSCSHGGGDWGGPLALSLLLWLARRGGRVRKCGGRRELKRGGECQWRWPQRWWPANLFAPLRREGAHQRGEGARGREGGREKEGEGNWLEGSGKTNQKKKFILGSCHSLIGIIRHELFFLVRFPAPCPSSLPSLLLPPPPPRVRGKKVRRPPSPGHLH